jgi:phospholipid-transporting ATPase
VLGNEFFPADLVLLSSSGRKGICYIETKNLDGETNLKHKISNKDVMALVPDEVAMSNLRAEVKCEGPTDKIYQFDGMFTCSDGTRISLNYDSFLLRGSSLRQTDWVVGLVTFTGHHTRIMKNSTGARTKFSRIEKQTNIQILFIFGLQCVLCLIAMVMGTFWRRKYSESMPYLALTNTFADVTIFDRNWILNAIQRYFTWILIFTNMVPISLMVTLEVVKFLQAFFIQWDYRIYDLDKDMPTKVQSSNLNEELG